MQTQHSHPRSDDIEVVGYDSATHTAYRATLDFEGNELRRECSDKFVRPVDDDPAKEMSAMFGQSLHILAGVFYKAFLHRQSMEEGSQCSQMGFPSLSLVAQFPHLPDQGNGEVWERREGCEGGARWEG